MPTFPKSVRLLRRGDFRRVMDDGAKTVCHDVVLFGAERPESAAIAGPRIGLVVSRKVGNSVVRNRVKRRLREAWRLQRHELECLPGFGRIDIAVVARVSAATRTGPELADGLRRCLDRLSRQVSNPQRLRSNRRGDDGTPNRS